MSDILLKDYISHLETIKEYYRERRILGDNPLAKMHNAKMKINYERVKSEIDSAKEWCFLIGGEI